MDEQAETLRDKRSSVILKALVRTGSNPEGVERRVRNLSPGGACVDHSGELSLGESVVLLMGEVTDLRAQVAWVTDRLAGLRFGRQVDLEAARRSRTAGPALKTGWMADMNHAYRRQG